MKRHGNLFCKVIESENIAYAYQRAKRGKMWQKKVRRVEKNKDELLEALRQSLIDKTFHTGEYKIKKVNKYYSFT